MDTSGMRYQPDGSVNPSGKYVTDIGEFRDKWGVRGAGLLVEAFVMKAPAFPGDEELAAMLGEMIEDLQTALGRMGGE